MMKTHGVGGHAPHIGNAATARCKWRLLEQTSIVEVPDWILGASVDWMDKYSNPPGTRFLVSDKPKFEPWTTDGKGAWTQKSADGMFLQVHYHSGHLIKVGDGEWETTKQEGYGGRTFTIEPVEGYGKVHLRGPWHGSAPQGYIDFLTIDRNSTYFRSGRPWHTNMECYGYRVHQDLYVAIMRKFCPDLPLAIVSRHGGAEHVEPCKAEWTAPKGFE